MVDIILELKLKIKDNLEEKIKEEVGIDNYINFEILKKSIDARKKNNIIINYRLKVKVKKNLNFLLDEKNNDTIQNLKLKNKNEIPIVIIGSGPAGLFCALKLLKANFKVILFERGKNVVERVKDVYLFKEKGIFNENSNVSYGLGGAGTFSDGKLNSGIKNPNVKYVLETFYQYGANEDILYDHLPHIGSDYLIKILDNMLLDINNLGGKIYFEHQLIDLEIKDNKVNQVIIKTPNEIKKIICQDLVLATGHACFDTFTMYNKYLYMEPKPFSMGLRIEHPQSLIDKIQYGKTYKELGPATYKINTRVNNRGVYSFCMCPGGEVIISSESYGKMIVNGMSLQKRDYVNANSALLVDVLVDDYYKTSALDGFDFIQKYEKKAFEIGNNFKAPVQRLEDFIKNKESTKIGTVIPSVKPGYILTNLSKCLPDFVYDSIKKAIYDFDKKMPGFLLNDAILTGVETRSSSPVRIKRDEYLRSNIENIYPCGEGSGYAGGITSACCDGIKIADSLITKYIK